MRVESGGEKELVPLGQSACNPTVDGGDDPMSSASSRSMRQEAVRSDIYLNKRSSLPDHYKVARIWLDSEDQIQAQRWGEK